MPTPQDAIVAPPPGPNGLTGYIHRNYATAVTAVASAVAAVLPSEGGVPYTGCYVSWSTTVDCHLRVYTLAGCGSATTSDFYLPAGSSKDWWHDPTIQTHFSVIRAATAAADGVITRYRSQR